MPAGLTANWRFWALFYWGDKTRRRASLSSSEVVSPEAESHAQLNGLEFGVPEASTFWYMQLLES